MDIVISDFTKKYGAQRAVDNISFTVKTGEILGFLGPNGAGKTTTMKAITTYLKPTDGDIMVGKYSVSRQPEAVKKLIGYLPENNPLYTEMPVVDYLLFVGELQGIAKQDLDNRVLEMIDICGLEGEKHKKISELSKGYKQRVGLAQALIHNPQVLILDEPTTGLDPNQIVEIRELIKKIGREKTVILSSHILAEVEATCDRIIIINKGKIVADGSANELRKKLSGKNILRISLEDADPNEAFEALKTVSGVEVVDFLTMKESKFELQIDDGVNPCRDIFQLCVDRKWVLTEMTPVETKLEDVFRTLTM
ncbi:MAG: ATP-binding cassette domain-containing protein [Bacteroidales bacterium]|nr:ATP-binding cassette domain-containing protein [Bacteroidales bacterium]